MLAHRTLWDARGLDLLSNTTLLVDPAAEPDLGVCTNACVFVARGGLPLMDKSSGEHPIGEHPIIIHAVSALGGKCGSSLS